MTLTASHAKQRAAERYGVDLSRRQLAYVVDEIRLGHSTMVRRSSHTRSVHDVTLEDGTVARVVYRRGRDIITFLPQPAQEKP